MTDHMTASERLRDRRESRSTRVYFLLPTVCAVLALFITWRALAMGVCG